MGKKLYVSLLVLSLVISVSALAEAACPTPVVCSPPQEMDPGVVVQCTVCFLGAGDTFEFSLDVTPGEGFFKFLSVDTVDRGIAGDRWGVEVTEPPFPQVIALPLIQFLRGEPVCGSGSASVFSGAMLIFGLEGGGETGTVELSYCGGLDLFPGEMVIRFQYNGEAMTVTPQ